MEMSLSDSALLDASDISLRCWLLLTEHLLQSIAECEIAGDTGAGNERFVTYVTSKMVSHLNDAVQHFQLVLYQYPIGHPDRAAALTNLA